MKASDVFGRGVNCHLDWHYESDGGDIHMGTHVLHSPKTHYLTNGEDRLDFDSKKEAIEYLDILKGECEVEVV